MSEHIGKIYYRYNNSHEPSIMIVNSVSDKYYVDLLGINSKPRLLVNIDLSQGEFDTKMGINGNVNIKVKEVNKCAPFEKEEIIEKLFIANILL